MPNQSASNRLIIVGANGFVGRHLLSQAVAQGREVIAIGSCSSVIELGKQSMTIHTQEVLKAMPVSGHDTIVYCAHIGPAGGHVVDKSIGEKNLNLLQQWINIANERSVRTFIFLSSGGAIYGEVASTIPVPETHPTIPIGIYGKLKLDMEAKLSALLNSATRFIILRIGNAYGLGQNSLKGQGFVDAAFRAAVGNTTLHLFGDGSERRDYVYVTCVANAILLASFAKDLEGIFNIGTGVATSNLEIIDLIQKTTGNTIAVNWSTRRPSDVHTISLDISKARHLIGWNPQISLTQGVTLLLRSQYK